MVWRDAHCPWDRRFDAISKTRKTGYFCVYKRFEYLTLWFGIAVVLDSERILWFYDFHCGANYSGVSDIRPSLVG